MTATTSSKISETRRHLNTLIHHEKARVTGSQRIRTKAMVWMTGTPAGPPRTRSDQPFGQVSTQLVMQV